MVVVVVVVVVVEVVEGVVVVVVVVVLGAVVVVVTGAVVATVVVGDGTMLVGSPVRISVGVDGVQERTRRRSQKSAKRDEGSIGN